MTTLGWIFMCLSLGFVVSLAVWCYSKVLSRPPEAVPKPAKDFHSA